MTISRRGAMLSAGAAAVVAGVPGAVLAAKLFEDPAAVLKREWRDRRRDIIEGPGSDHDKLVAIVRTEPEWGQPALIKALQRPLNEATAKAYFEDIDRAIAAHVALG